MHTHYTPPAYRRMRSRSAAVTRPDLTQKSGLDGLGGHDVTDMTDAGTAGWRAQKHGLDGRDGRSSAERGAAQWQFSGHA
jgi:hypothetical protein|eukprot:COSAG01_NODE_34394_length_548_cov_1.256125_1_plen_80_part_00